MFTFMGVLPTGQGFFHGPCRQTGQAPFCLTAWGSGYVCACV